MASQISHIIYAKKFFDSAQEGKIEIGRKIDKDEFLLGCVFPDIRRIDKNIQRKDTHLKFYPLDLNFSGPSSFEAGWKFHLYCDMKREDILKKYGFYTGKENDGFYEFAAKMLEDELVYKEYNNWEKIINYFNNPAFPKIENLEINPETFRLWYAMVSKYAQKNPTSKTIRTFLTKQPRLQKNIDEIMEKMETLRQDKKAVKILGNIYEEIV